MIGERIKQKREEKGITQEQLAKAIGCKNKASISRIENSGNKVSLVNIGKIAKALDCSVTDLIGDDATTLEDLFGYSKVQPISNEKTDKLYSKNHIKLISKYEKLSRQNKRFVTKLINTLLKEEEKK